MAATATNFALNYCFVPNSIFFEGRTLLNVCGAYRNRINMPGDHTEMQMRFKLPFTFLCPLEGVPCQRNTDAPAAPSSQQSSINTGMRHHMIISQQFHLGWRFAKAIERRYFGTKLVSKRGEGLMLTCANKTVFDYKILFAPFWPQTAQKTSKINFGNTFRHLCCYISYEIYFVSLLLCCSVNYSVQLFQHNRSELPLLFFDFRDFFHKFFFQFCPKLAHFQPNCIISFVFLFFTGDFKISADVNITVCNRFKFRTGRLDL